MKVTVYQQRTPLEVGGEYRANLVPIKTIEARSFTEALESAKTWTAFRVGRGLAHHPIVGPA